MSSFCKAWGISRTAVSYRLSTGLSLEEAVDKLLSDTHTVYVDGKKFDNLGLVAKAYGVSRNCLSTHVNKNKLSEKDIIALKKRNDTSVVYKDKRYKNLKVLADAFGADYKLLKSRVRQGWSIERALTEDLVYLGHEVEFQGKTYSSYYKLAKAFNIDYTLLMSRLRKDSNLEKALLTEVATCSRGTPVTYEGEKYPSIMSVCKAYKIVYKSLLYRLDKGESVEVASDHFRNRRKWKKNV